MYVCGRCSREREYRPVSSSCPVLFSPLLQGKAYLDALPYIDGEIDPEMREHVDRLILEEMQNPRFPTR